MADTATIETTRDPVLDQESGFVHLHDHSEYSSLDGGSRVSNMVAKLESLGMKSMALTDHGVMQGLPTFYNELKKAGMKPILGMEAYLTNDRHDKSRGTPTWHLTLLAETTEGYHNLCKLSSWAFMEGTIMTFGRARARADWELLERYSKGVIAFTGCMASPVMGAIFNGDLSAAYAHTEHLISIYGKDNVYGEIQNVGITIGIPGDSEIAKLLGKTPLTAEEAARYEEVEAGQVPLSQTEANGVLVDHICKPLGLKYVGTGDTHYLNEDDAEPHDIMICIGTAQTKKGPRRFSLLPKKYHMRPEKEMLEALKAWPEAIATTKEVALRCNAEIEYGRELLPEYPLPEGFTDSGAYLRHLCEAGLDERYPEGSERRAEALERLEMELGVIASMGFNDYFLITWDLYAEAARRDIPSGPGRGSAAGSIVAYCLDITKLCPLEYGLLFERFLNPGRRSMPDIDMDFAEGYNGGRKALMQYAVEKYNANADCLTAVAQIVTFSRYRAKNAIKDAARVLAEPDAAGEDINKKDAMKLGDRLAALVPAFPGVTMSSLWDGQHKREGEQLRAASKKGGLATEIINEAGWLEGMIKTYGLHAAAVIIASHDMTEDLPLQRFAADKPLHTQYDMGICEALGLLKMDFLGLKTLDIIWDACAKIEAVHGIKLNPWRDIPIDDGKTYDLFAAGETVGTFQFESTGMRASLQEVRPTELRDLIALVALYRPGAMAHIPTYAARKNGRQEVRYLDPRLEEIQKETYGVTVYQETSMQISRALAGFSQAEADDLRKAIGKKLRDKMDALKPKYLAGCKTNDVALEVAQALWADNEAAAEYSFNKCAYAGTLVRTADGRRIKLSAAYKEQPKELMAMWGDGHIAPHAVKRIVSTGRKPLYEIRTEGGKQIKVTAEHRLLTTEGYKQVQEMQVGTELITVPVFTEERARRSQRMHGLAHGPERAALDARAATRMRDWQAGRSPEEKAAHMRRVHALHPDMTNAGVAAMHARIAWLRANDSEWVRAHAEASLASVHAVYDTGPGFGRCSIASNGMWCASSHERAMCEHLIEQGIDFEMHKVLDSGRICDFYFAGLYWEMDGMDREDAFFANKYGDLPYVVVTPEDYKMKVSHELALEHAENGDPIVSIEYWGEGPTYDVEMCEDGPKNFLANNIVSHNSHAACYAYVSYITGWLKVNYPHEFMAALLTVAMGDKDKPRIFLTEAKRMGLRVLPPDINRSFNDFAVVEREEEPGSYDILFGLTAIRGVGEGVVREIRAERDRHGFFTSIYDLIRRMPALNKTVLHALVKGGALDGAGATRRGMFDVVEEAQKAIKKERDAEEKAFLVAVRTRIEKAETLAGNSGFGEQQTLLGEAVGVASPEAAFNAAMGKTRGSKRPGDIKLTMEEKRGLEGGCRVVWAANLDIEDSVVANAIEEALKKEALRLARKTAKDSLKGENDAEISGIAQEEQGEASIKNRAEEIAQTEVSAKGLEIKTQAVEFSKRFLPHIHAEVEEREQGSDLDAALAAEADPALSVEEWDRIEMLNIERNMLGIYVTGHPLDEDAEKWRLYVTEGTERGRELGEVTDADIDNTIIVVGAVVGKQGIRMRSGEIMYRVAIEDLSGSREVTIFPRTLEGGLEALLTDGQIVCLEVLVQEDTFQQQRNDEAVAEEGEIIGAEEEDSAERPIKLMASRIYRWQPDKITPEFVAQAKARAAARAAEAAAVGTTVDDANTSSNDSVVVDAGGGNGSAEGGVVTTANAENGTAGAGEPKPVSVRITSSQFNPKWVTRLEAVCTRYPGDHPVKLVLDGKTYRTKFAVAPSKELADGIKTLLHEQQPQAAETAAAV